MMERREFIQACAVLLGSSITIAGCGRLPIEAETFRAGSGGSSESGGTTDVSAESGLNKQRWMELPSTTFSVAHETFGAIDMQLTNIEDEFLLSSSEQFSVTLTGPEMPLFAEDRYQVYNASLGYIELYLQPGESAPGEQNYRAIFNLLA